jgi:eukaryotic-like serine/threonine-protein kinase
MYASLGQYEKAAESTSLGLPLLTDNVSAYGVLANQLIASQRLEEARRTVEEAHARKLDDLTLHNVLYALAFLGGDSGELNKQEQWFAANQGIENNGLSLASDTQAYVGHCTKARELTKRSVDSAVRADSRETGGIWWENAALRESAFGDGAKSREAAAAGLRLYPASLGVMVEAALAYAVAGDSPRAQALAQDLDRRYPLDTQVQALWLPAVRGQLALNRKNPSAAINYLASALPPIEYGFIPFLNPISCLYPSYIRGQAYLAAEQGKEAAAEFQKILDHTGIVWNCWTGALARLGVARASALQAKNSTGVDVPAARARAIAAYKDFLTLWRDADPEIPVLKQAKEEYAKLQKIL